MAELVLRGRVIIPGEARGQALVSREPLSFWGGYDWKTGEITETQGWRFEVVDMDGRRVDKLLATRLD